MGFSESVRDDMLDWYFGNEPTGGITIPDYYYVALIRTDDNEPSGGGYTRVQTETSDWGQASGGEVANVSAITFPAPTGDWGTIDTVHIYDAASGGNLLAEGTITESIEVLAGGTTPEFAIDSFVIQLT